MLITVVIVDSIVFHCLFFEPGGGGTAIVIY